MEERVVFEKLLQYENDIINHHNDDESQHILEDEMHKFFIDNCHRISKEQIIACQTIIRRVEIMKFSRWCA